MSLPEPHPASSARGKTVSGLALVFAVVVTLFPIAAPLRAFPPSPYYTLYGTVRDQVGNTLAASGAQIILLSDGVELGRAPITGALRADQNYELRVRIDQNRAGTAAYSSYAVPAQGLYSLAVQLGGQLYYPIEVSGTLRAGQGGERILLDLNLGADSDGDGLPDAWEEWQLYQSGEYPGSLGWNLARITRDGDFDGDGVPNQVEYVAGTFAGDATERFELKIVSLANNSASFEFFAITGKVYRIEASSDLRTWNEIPFSVGAATQPALFYRAQDIGVLPARADFSAGSKMFYRLTVR